MVGGQGSLASHALLTSSCGVSILPLSLPRARGGVVSLRDIFRHVTPTGQWGPVPGPLHRGAVSSGNSVCPSHNMPG